MMCPGRRIHRTIKASYLVWSFPDNHRVCCLCRATNLSDDVLDLCQLLITYRLREVNTLDLSAESRVQPIDLKS